MQEASKPKDLTLKPPLPTKNAPSQSERQEAQEPKGLESKGKDPIVPQMTMMYEKTPLKDMAK